MLPDVVEAVTDILRVARRGRWKGKGCNVGKTDRLYNSTPQ